MPPTAARLPILADRNTPLALVLRFRRMDLTGATMRAQVRALPDLGGPPLVDLGTVEEPRVLGLWLRAVSGAGDELVSEVELFIPERQWPLAPEVGADLALAWDMTIKPAGGVEQKRLYGPFTVVAGVTK